MINFNKLNVMEKRSVIKKASQLGSISSIKYKNKEIVFDKQIVVAYQCGNCNAFHRFNIYPTSLPFLSNNAPCSRCNKQTYLKFITDDELEKSTRKYLKTKGTILEYFIEEKIEDID